MSIPRKIRTFCEPETLFLYGCVGLFLFLVVTALFPIFSDAFHFALAGSSGGDVFEGMRHVQLFLKSILFSSIIAFVGTSVGFGLSYCISRYTIRFRAVWTLLLIVPVLMPSHLYCMLWMISLGNEGMLGWLNCSMSGIGALLWVQSLYYMPFAFLCGLIGLGSIERRLEECGLLYWDRRHSFRKVIFPLAKPYLFLGWVIIFILSLNEYGVPILTQVNLFTTEIFLQFNSLFNPQVAVLQSIILIIVVAMVVLGSLMYFARKRFVTLRGANVLLEKRECGWRGFLMYSFLAAGVFCITIIPLATMIESINSLSVFRTTVVEAWDQIVNSVVCALLCVLFGGLLGFAIAYLLTRKKNLSTSIIDILMYVIFALPSIIIGVGLILFWNKKGVGEVLYSSIFIVIIGLMIKYLPVMIKAFESSMERYSSSLDEAAQVSGLSLRKRIWFILAPLNVRGALIGAVVLFIFCMNELNIPLLLHPPGKEPLSIRLFTLMHFAPDNVLMSSGLCIILINVLFCGIAGIIYMFLSRKLNVV